MVKVHESKLSYILRAICHNIVYIFTTAKRLSKENQVYVENAFAPCANIVEFDTLDELIGTAIAAYLVATNNTDKINRLFITIDGHLSIGNDTNMDYAETINDKDVYADYIVDVKNGIKKF